MEEYRFFSGTRRRSTFIGGMRVVGYIPCVVKCRVKNGLCVTAEQTPFCEKNERTFFEDRRQAYRLAVKQKKLLQKNSDYPN
jgi:hypothetical protein